MEPYVQRLIEEHQQVKDRWIKLRDFIEHNGNFSSLPEVQQALMMRQKVLMEEYVSILEERLRFNGIEPTEHRDFSWD